MQIYIPYVLGWLVVLNMMVIIYSRTVVNLLWDMYKYHRLEFKRHYQRMLVLYLATMMSLVYVMIG